MPLSVIKACDGWNPLASELNIKTWGQFVFEKMNKVMEYHEDTMTDLETESDIDSTVTETDEGIETLNS